MNPLPQAPASLVDEGGATRFGLYRGRMADTSLGALAGRFRRAGLARLAEKRWLYASVASPEVLAAFAVVDLGWGAGGFCYVFDRAGRRLVADETFRLPGKLVEVRDRAGEAWARLRSPRSRMSIAIAPSFGRISASVPGLLAEVRLLPNGSPAPLTAVCPVPGDGVSMTQKAPLVPAEGEIRVGGRVFALSRAFASLDLTHGYLARSTCWRWASGCGLLADGRRFGINLVQGHNDGPVSENGLWLEDRLWPLGEARFDFDPDRPAEPWSISTDDGRVQLRFSPEGLRREEFDYRLVSSSYVQPVGTFGGVVRTPDGEELAVEALPGVTEDHRSRW